MNTSYNSGNDPQEEEYDPDWDRVCSYPCHVCGEEDDWEDDE